MKMPKKEVQGLTHIQDLGGVLRSSESPGCPLFLHITFH